ncbi:helix-turn-helix domain-containing protein [Halobacillus sp. A5]|uniref:helix-turn-helix domain-containing protein n=1 Tax=Halobacillus sp. A5 TaxID=2880263 RepID=UPI0020A69B1C|nr:helix-turn-helix domain-containing protein [Halobacillus sp. A5]MCP3026904.1 helix-turn-helix domain-containing protein [Halobacillus sp. A5]
MEQQQVKAKVGELTQEGFFLKVYAPLFNSGISKDIGMDGVGLLITIASYMNKHGEAYPTQRQLAEKLGVRPNTITRQVKKLLEYRYNGKPIITRELRENKRGANNSVYRIKPISQIAVFEGKREEVIFHKKND